MTAVYGLCYHSWHMSERIYTISQAATELGITRARVHKLIKNRSVPVKRIPAPVPYYVLTESQLDGLRQRPRKSLPVQAE